MRFEPLPVTARHPLGKGPFRARGILFEGLLRHVTLRTPGGMAAVHAAIADPAVSAFFDQIFLASASYDLAVLIRVLPIVTRLERTAVEPFVRERARVAAEEHIAGLYRQQLKVSSPMEMASRMPRIFGRYYEPCQAELIANGHEHLEIRFGKLPALMLGYYVWSNEGFIGRALEIAGAQPPRMEWSVEVPDGEFEGIPLRAVVLRAGWTLA